MKEAIKEKLINGNIYLNNLKRGLENKEMVYGKQLGNELSLLI